MRVGPRTRLLWAGTLAAAGLSLPAWAAGPDRRAETTQASIAYDIPAQPLAAAVEAYALTTGVQVLYDRPLGGEPQSPGVRGLLTPQAALVRLLAGTGLVGRFTDPRNVILELPSTAGQNPAAAGEPPRGLPSLQLGTLHVLAAPVLEAQSSPGADARLYGDLIKTRLAEVLAKDARTSKSAYVAGLSIWIGASGAVEQVSIFSSTGRKELDAAICAVLEEVVLIETPPAGVTFPMNVRISSRKPR